MPAVLLVLALCVGALQALTQRVMLLDAAASSARALARGEVPPGMPGQATAEMTEERRGDLVCVTLARPATGPLGLLGVPIAATSCAAAGGR
ncbi:hypothetical protein [Naasia aerilata]|uniref:TadE-like protein n=1 Tax=Naasia aerilata TaxID=1162966 RepID=A0ABM8GC01_9MICO|nr:hypothetical protein [Naasia aerilata]BDZ45766.1 hypothetical protein GCM10025866_16750 [Naasia aerilata]